MSRRRKDDRVHAKDARSGAKAFSMVEMKEGCIIHRAWMVMHNPLIENCDWLGTLWTNPGEPTRGAYRFRYHREHLGLPDLKRYYGPVEIAHPIDGTIRMLEESAVHVSRIWGGTPIFRLRDASSDDVVRWLQNLQDHGHIILTVGTDGAEPLQPISVKPTTGE